MSTLAQSLDLRVEKTSFQSTAEGLEISFTARNTGDRPLYVQSVVRQVEWDAASRRLTVWFSDRGRRDETRHNTDPRTEILEAREAKRIVSSLPPKLTRIIPEEDGSFDFEVIETEQAESVRLVVGAAPIPFYFNPKGGGHLEQLKSWGGDVEVRGRVKAEKTKRRKKRKR